MITGASDKLATTVQRRLTFKNPKYEAIDKYSPWGYNSEPEYLHLAQYDSGRDCLSFPRGFDLNLLPEPLRQEILSAPITDERTEVPATFPSEKIKLRPAQKLLLQQFKIAVRANLRPFGNYLMLAGTSEGKTIAQAVCAKATGMNTMVIFPTNLIRDAWLDDLDLLYGLGKDDLGLFQQQKKVIRSPFTLASASTLHRRRENWEQIFSHFGCVVIDEADITGNNVFTDILDFCSCKYIIGASATEKEHSSYGFYFQSYFGKPIHKIQISASDTANAMAVTDVIEHRTSFEMEFDYESIDLQEITQNVILDHERNLFIAEHIYEDWLNDHSVLVAVKHHLHVEAMSEYLLKLGVRNITRITGRTNNKLIVPRIKARKSRCVVATIDAIKRGANINPLNRLHICWPVMNATDVEQIVGRIRRKHPSKYDCVVHTYIDEKCSYLGSKYKKAFIPVFRKLKVPRFQNLLY